VVRYDASRKWSEYNSGLSLDNITGYELVTATGDIICANAKENPDLFVGMRGAGFNFGVVTKFFVKLHPIGHIPKSPSDPNADKVCLHNCASTNAKGLAIRIVIAVTQFTCGFGAQVIGGVRIYPYAQAEHMWKTLRVSADPFTLDRRVSIMQALAHGPDGKPCAIIGPAYTGRDLDQGFKVINEVVKFDVRDCLTRVLE